MEEQTGAATAAPRDDDAIELALEGAEDEYDADLGDAGLQGN